MSVEELYTGKPTYQYAVVDMTADPSEVKELAEIYARIDSEGRRQLMEYARFVGQTHSKNSGLRQRESA